MRKRLLYLMLLVIAMTCSMQLNAQQNSKDALQGVVRVKLQREVADRLTSAPLPQSQGAIVQTGVTQLDRANSKVGARTMRRLIPYSPAFEQKHRAAGLDLWYEITFDETAMSPASAREVYKNVAGVTRAETVRPMTLIGNGEARVVAPAQLAAQTQNTTLPFNDPMLGSQWHYHNDGSLPQSVAGADANVFEAWKVETGKQDVIVAIIDGGFQLDHPDLAQNVWVNEAELNGEPGVDDDGNGYTDDIYGWNFVIGSNDLSSHNHGTHVAGTVAAVNGNGIGVCGVAGGQDGQGGVRIMAAQVFDNRSSAEANFAAALVYAADMGADIAQCSWGWSDSGYYEQAVLDAVDYFTQNSNGKKMSGGLCIFANGNTGTEGDFYPAAYETAVAVAAMDPLMAPASYSSRGSWCDVTAPGGNVDYGEAYGVLSTLPGGTYGYMDGTSMACPHVSGIAALILSKYGNDQFPNSTLRQQLVASVNDFYTRNPDAEGLFGSGYIDAYKALQVGSGAPPEQISSFVLTPSQDNILVEWTIPQAEEGSVDHHVIYYSQTEFDASTNLQTLSSAIVDTKFYSSGDAMAYELDGLTPLTTYYVAIVPVNRYGNAAAMSPVMSATTNEGPTTSIDKTSLSLTVDATTSSVASDEFAISNTGKGILNYKLSATTVRASISSSSNHAPTPGRVVPASKGISAYAAVSDYPVVTAEFEVADFPQQMTWSKGIYQYIGDDVETNPNALAQYFYVDPNVYPDGFNLTAVNIGGPGDSFSPTIEIYNGSQAISTASLLTTVSYDFFMYNYDLNLSEQLFFAPGSSFWIVVKFQPGENNPLGAGLANTSNARQYSFYSNNNGQTWTQLSEVLREGNLASLADSLVWDVTAISKNPDWSSVLSPEPINGTVRPGESQTVTVKNDGQSMVNGTYTFNLHVNTNETSNPTHNVAVSMAVSGNTPELTSAKVIDFGELLVGQSKTLSVEIANTGYGAFKGNYGYLQTYNGGLASSSNEFKTPSSHSGFAARSKGTIDITFSPTSAGSKSATVTMKSAKGVTYSFVVRGVASMPAKVNVEPTSIDFGELEMGGEAKTAEITISNTGEYPLEYVFPRFSDEIIEGIESHKFGYTYESNINGSTDFDHDGNPDLLNETDITSQFDDITWQSDAIDLGFQFPFYGTNYSQVYINSRGAVAFNKLDGNIQCMVPVASCVQGLGYVSAFACSGNLHFGANSKITYGRQDGKFTVKYKNVLAPVYGDEYTPVSFHMSLCADGSVEVYYDDYDPWSVFGSGAHTFIGVADTECADPFVVTDSELANDEGSMLYQSIQSGTAVRIVAPSTSMVSALSTTSGVVGVGESATVTITAKAVEGMYAGELTNNLTIVSNDPLSPSTNVVLKAIVTGDQLVPVAQLQTENIEFGDVFRTSTQTRSVLLSNNGTNDLVINSIVIEGGKFTVPENIATGFTVRPGYGKDILVTLPTENEGAVSDKLIVTYADGTTAEVALSGNVIGCPEISVSPESLSVNSEYGQILPQTLTVANNGNETLTFSVEPNEWINITDLVADENSSVGYQYKSKTDYNDISYNWVDITNDAEATHQDFTYYIDKTDYYTVELPFEFPFYGKNYKTMYIYNTGFVSFTQHTDYKEFPAPPTGLPTTDTFYTNIIAPYWGNHTMDVATTNGTYYKAEDDHVVVSFIGYGNSVMIGMDFQVILYKDGTYKFQYHLQDDGMMNGVYGLAGMQDENGTTGLQLPDQCIASGNAVEFYPVKTFNVAPGEQVEMPMELITDRYAGEYTTNVVLQTNVPTQPTVEVPVNISISGEAVPVFPESVTGEDVADYVTGYTERYYEFTISNNGTRAFTVTNATYDDPTYSSSLQVYTIQNDPLMGGTFEGWTTWPMDYMTFAPGTIEVGKEPLRMRLVVMDFGQPSTYTSPIVLSLSGLDITEKQIPVNITLTDAPTLTTSPVDGVTVEGVEISDNYTGIHSMTIGNEGQYKLTYSLRMDPSGVGEEVEDNTVEDGGGIAPWSNNVLAQLTKSQAESLIKSTSREITAHTVFSGFAYDVPAGYDCNNILYYPILGVQSPQSYIIGTGDTEHQFRAATRFTAPAEGFNLSKMYFVGTIGDLENVDITAQVIQGNDVTSGQVIGQGTLRVESETPYNDGNYYGVPRMLSFDKPVYINPGDDFYVVLTYPAGYGSSALIAQKQDAVESGRFMAYNASYGWYDLGEELYNSYYSSFGYFMTCIEDEPGKPWIKLLTTETEGELAVGETKEIQFEIDAESSYFAHGNKAVLVIKSNDPAQKVVNYPIMLNKNAAPEVTLPEGTTTVPETQTADMYVTVSDLEGEAFTVSLSDESGIATIGSCTAFGNEGAQAIEPVDGVINVPAGSTLQMVITLAPDYGTAGLHTAVISVEDASGNHDNVAAIYNVEFTNRAPIYEGEEEISIIVGSTTGIITYDNIFNDPDDDEMTYTATMPTNTAASIFLSTNGFMISGDAVGSTVLTLSATDAHGTRTSVTVPVHVTTPTGIENATNGKNITVTPNPVVNEVNITLGTDAENVNYYVYNNGGALVAKAHASTKAAGDAQTIDISNCPVGVYRIKVTTAKGSYNATVVKK